MRKILLIGLILTAALAAGCRANTATPDASTPQATAPAAYDHTRGRQGCHAGSRA